MPNQIQEYDVIIKGAGIAGLGVACGLAHRKQNVLVVDTQSLKGSGSLAAAGILHPFFCQTEKSPIIPILSEAFHFFSPWLKKWAPQAIGKAVHSVGMNYVACGSTEEEILEEQYAWQIKKGIRIQKVNPRKMIQKNSQLSKSVSMALHYKDVGYLEPEFFLKMLRENLQAKGVSFYESSKPVHITEKNRNFLLNLADGRKICSTHYVDASGAWLANNPSFSSVIEAVRGELFLVANKNINPRQIFHTVNEFYVLPWGKKATLLGSTTDAVGFRPNVTGKGKTDVFAGVEKIFPQIVNEKVIRSWAGLRPRTTDRLPLLGRIKKDSSSFAVGGYYKNGMLLGPYLGDRLADWIVSGKQDPVIKILDTNRFENRKQRNGS